MPAALLPLTRDLLLVGGGHAHALLLRRWGMKPLPGTRVTVINPGPTAPYTGMLPGFVAGHYTREELEIDLVRLARFAGARLILGRAEAMDPEAGHVTVAGRGRLRFDVASIDIGIHSGMPDLPGFAEHATAAKPLETFARGWSAHLDRLRADPALAGRGLAVIGGGVAGVELAMAMVHGARQAAGRVGPVHVIEAGAALTGIGDGAARALRARLAAMGIVLLEEAKVERLDAGGLTLADGRRIPAAFTTGAAGARPHGWLARTGVALKDGFVRVGPTLATVEHPDVFAVGDCAHMDHAPRPKAGVFAVRQAPVLYDNICAALGAGSPRPYRPQRDYLKLISLGEKAAVADKFGLRLEGRLLWRWKDRIDRAFMDRLADLPTMKPPALPAFRAAGMEAALNGGKPMCGGCGSKLGQAGLREALAALPPVRRADVESAPGDDAAILSVGGAKQVLTTDHLRAFTEDPALLSRIAAVHALGDVFAMGAEPQAALATVILPRAAPEIHADMMAEIMGAASGVFRAEGAEIAGGHTMIGEALSLGFTVTGLPDRAVTLAGAQHGDALLLTKPIGSGTILAGEMALAARGPWVAGALAAMQQSQGAASRVLKASARAMTDVTGFGLAGHLMGILRASGCAAELVLDDMPLMDGAAELARQGVRSTLHPQNRGLASAMTLPDRAEAELLFDPQTAGGLLAAVPEEAVEGLLERLRQEGYAAVRIGRIVEGAPFIAVL
nr:selenide, water dikinase SelD [Kandeliimicrobium roseum]